MPPLCFMQIFLKHRGVFSFPARYGHTTKPIYFNLKEDFYMAFFASAIDTLKILVIALGAGLGAWGVINLLEGYGNDNRATRS